MNLASIGQDLRHTVRAAVRTPGTTAVLLLSLALGTGANAAVYGVMSGLLLAAPPGVQDPPRLVNIFTSEFSGATHGPSLYADYLSLASETSVFAAVAAIDDRAVENVTIGAASAAARIAAVSDSFFTLLDMRAQSGTLPPAPAASSQTAAVVSFPLAEQLGGAESVVGQRLTIAGRPYTVIGVTPPRFRGLQIGRECDVWIPLAAPPAQRGDRRLAIVARLAPEARLRSAADALRRLSGDLAERYPQTNRGDKDRPDAPRRITPVRYSQLDPSAGDQVSADRHRHRQRVGPAPDECVPQCRKPAPVDGAGAARRTGDQDGARRVPGPPGAAAPDRGPLPLPRGWSPRACSLRCGRPRPSRRSSWSSRPSSSTRDSMRARCC